MARQIFRQEAIDSMASPDRLDQPLQLVRPANWIFLAIGGAVILFALVWGFTSRVPIEVQARGILISANGLFEISTQYEGRVEEILVAPGDSVSEGQVIARLSRSSREREIRAAEAALRDAMAQARAAESTYRQGESGLTAAESRMLASLRTRTAELRQLLATRQQTVENMRGLVAQNAATQEELASVIASRDELRAELRRLEQERLDIGVTSARRRSERGQTRLTETQLVEQRRRELAQLRAQTDDEVLLRARQSGEVLEIRANEGDVIGAGQAIATIDGGEASQAGENYQAILYATPASGKRIAPGMQVEIVPTTAEREVYGHIQGEVVSGAIFPASREAMLRVLQNERLVDELSAEGAPIEIRVRLNRAPGNRTGFAWSSSDGPAWAITRGTMLEADVVLERRPLIAVLFPSLADSGSRAAE